MASDSAWTVTDCVTCADFEREVRTNGLVDCYRNTGFGHLLKAGLLYRDVVYAGTGRTRRSSIPGRSWLW